MLVKTSSLHDMIFGVVFISSFLLRSQLVCGLSEGALVKNSDKDQISERLLMDEFLEAPQDEWADLRSQHIARTKARQLADNSDVIGTGWWSTRGNKIIDSNGNTVYFSGINWDGFEYQDCVIDGIKPGMNRSIRSHLRQMKAVGFNLIRLPFASTCIQPGVKPTVGSVDYTYNPDLTDLTTFEIYKKVVGYAGELGIKVIVDYHRIAPPFAPQYAAEFGLWYNETYPVSFFVDTWKFVVQEFVNDSTVVGVDIFNEPHNHKDHEGPFWLGYDEAKGVNFRTVAKVMGDIILDINPNLLICVEGMWQDTWFGENLSGVLEYPLELKVPNKLVYSVHDYGPLLQVQPWHHTEDYPDNLVGFWDQYWGFVHTEAIAPVWVGEFGSLFNRTPNAFITEEQARLSDVAEWKWLTTFLAYIQEHQLVWTWFCWSPNAINVGGILDDDWTTLRADKVAVLKPLMYPNFTLQAPPPPAGSPPPSPPVLETGGVIYEAPPTPGVLAPVGSGLPGTPPAAPTISGHEGRRESLVLKYVKICALAYTLLYMIP